MQRPLANVRVLDLAWVGAGSYTTRLLADLGADVIKIESHRKVDGLRLAGPFARVPKSLNTSGYFADRNASKRSVTVDLTSPEGQQLVLDLSRKCDVIANNFSPGVMDRLGLSPDAVLEANPAIVYLAMSMMGSSGPHHKFIGYGLNISALSGLHHFSGAPNREPVGTGTHFPDHIPNPTHATFAVLAALRHARRTGQGQVIDMSQVEPMVSHLAPLLLEWAWNGTDQGRQANQHHAYAPHGVYPCAGDDVWVAIAVRDDDQWRSLLEAFEMTIDGLSVNSATTQRLERRHDIDAEIGKITAGLEVDDIVRRLRARGVPVAKVNTPEDVVDRDEQLKHRHHWVRLPHQEMGTTVYNQVPFRYSNRDTAPQRAAPLIGEHTDEVLSELLGMDEASIARLKDAEVLH